MMQNGARFHYNRAELYSNLSWLIAIANIIINKAVPSRFIYPTFIVMSLFMLAAVFFQLSIKKHIEKGAALRKYVDYNLFKFGALNKYYQYSKEELIEISLKARDKNSRRASIEMRNTGNDKPRGVKDWYTGIKSSYDRYIAILECQKQNVWWDKSLSKIYINIMQILLIFTFFIFIIFCLGKTTPNILSMVISVMTFIGKVILEFITVSEYRKQSIKIDTLLTYNPDTLSDQHLLKIQEEIDNRRKMPFLASNLLHKLNTQKFHRFWAMKSRLIDNQ